MSESSQHKDKSEIHSRPHSWSGHMLWLHWRQFTENSFSIIASFHIQYMWRAWSDKCHQKQTSWSYQEEPQKLPSVTLLLTVYLAAKINCLTLTVNPHTSCVSAKRETCRQLGRILITEWKQKHRYLRWQELMRHLRSYPWGLIYGWDTWLVSWLSHPSTTAKDTVTALWSKMKN